VAEASIEIFILGGESGEVLEGKIALVLRDEIVWRFREEWETKGEDSGEDPCGGEDDSECGFVHDSDARVGSRDGDEEADVLEVWSDRLKKLW
jgi:hypothetical protein